MNFIQTSLNYEEFQEAMVSTLFYSFTPEVKDYADEMLYQVNEEI